MQSNLKGNYNSDTCRGGNYQGKTILKKQADPFLDGFHLIVTSVQILVFLCETKRWLFSALCVLS